MTVSFCGHRDSVLGKEQGKKLEETIENLILQGAACFLLGGYGNFDEACAKAVWNAKGRHPQIRSILVLPYLNEKTEVRFYDESVYPPLENVPKRFAVSKRNEWMVEQSDVLVSGVENDWGGAYQMLKYAKRKHKTVISLFEQK